MTDTRHKVRCIVSALVAAVMVAIVPAAAVDDAILLSRNATYKVIGETYLYANQHLPGTNDRAVSKHGYRRTPLVEMTDTGHALIDGDHATKIHTPWHWRRNGKRVTVEMALPGVSTVSRVHVQLPKEPELRPQNVRVDYASPDGKWVEVDLVQSGPEAAHAPPQTRQAGHTFDLNDVQTGGIRVMCVDQGVVTAQCGIAEIEVYGQGPVESSQRGIVRSPPHVESVTPSAPLRADSATLLAANTAARVKLSGTSVTGGQGAMLIDDDASTIVMIDNERHKETSLTAEIDLGRRYVVESVNVWLPGGHGVENGHVNGLTLAISPSDSGRDWQLPVDAIINSYWPDDPAPRPYVIPLGPFKIAGRRVRVDAHLSGAGGRTNRLALAEIEIRGRPVDAATKDDPRPQLELEPLAFTPESVGELHPDLRWLATDKIQGIWAGENLHAPFEGSDKTIGQVLVDAGFNLYVTLMGPHYSGDRSTSVDLDTRLAPNVAEARRLGLKFMVVWQYGSVHQEPYPRYRDMAGHPAVRSCCPLDEEYFERHIGRWARRVAREGADGILLDTEMYESDQTRYPGACTCDQCFAYYVDTFSADGGELHEQIAPKRRGLWLKINGATDHYTRFAAKRLERQYDRLRQQCQAINPVFLFAQQPFLCYLPGIERGLGTSDVPCLVFSGAEYNHGITSRSYGSMKQIREEGIPALYVCGFFLMRHTPQMVTEQAVPASLWADGWWLWYGSSILKRVGLDDPKAFNGPYGRCKETTAGEYLNAVTNVHSHIRELRKRPPSEWPRPDGFPEELAAGSHAATLPKIDTRMAGQLERWTFVGSEHPFKQREDGVILPPIWKILGEGDAPGYFKTRGA